MTSLALKDYQIAYSKDVKVDIEFVLKEGFKPVDRINITPFNVLAPVQWAKDPFSDRNWMYQLHSWRMLDPFFNRMNESDRNYVGQLMTDWFTFYKANPKATGWFWYDMSTGIRASKLAFLIAWCHQNAEPIPLKEWVLADLLKTHLQHLTNIRELSSGNHGLFQLTGLMGLIDAVETTGVYSTELAGPRIFAIDNLSRLLKEQLGNDGIHTEHSPSYHLFIATKIKQVLAAPWWRIQELDWARKLVDSAYIAKGWMLTPAMKCPPVGDSEEKTRQEKLDRMTQWPHEEAFGVLGASLDGYGIIKSKPNVPIDQSHYLFFQCSFNSGSHKHADCLSFLWQEAGQYLLHDSGKYSYQRDEVRDYFMSTRAHNCLEVDGESYSTRNQDAYGSGLQQVRRCGDGWLLHGHVVHSRLGVEQRRFIYYLPGVGVDVLDVVNNRRPEKRQYRLWWQLGPDTTIESLNEKVSLQLPDGKQLVGSFEVSAGHCSLLGHRGEEEPRMAGWISRSYLEYEPSTAVSVNVLSGDKDLYLVSSWRLGGHVDVSPVFNISNHKLHVTSEALSASVDVFLRKPSYKLRRQRRYVRLINSLGGRYPLVGHFLNGIKGFVARQRLRSLPNFTTLRGNEAQYFENQLSKNLSLEAVRIGVDSRSLSFLADSRSRDVSLKGIFCASMSGRIVLMSTDVGASWVPFWRIPDGSAQRVDRLFVGSRAIFLKLKGPAEMVVLSLEGESLHKVKNGAYPWHGAQGVSESDSGTVMYAEYQTGDEDHTPTLSVWKSEPPYQDWHAVLSKTAARSPEGDIRHFHTCVADPFNAGVWYVSSGDSNTHNRLWMSIDDGSSWRELSVSCEQAQAHGIMQPARLLRYTSVSVNSNGMLWATDDGLGIGKSAVIRCQPDYERCVANVTIVGFLGKNYARSLIKMSCGYLVVTESKNDKEYVDFWYLSAEGVPQKNLRKINHLALKSPVTDSQASPTFVDGVAIIPDLGVFSGERGGILALKVS